MAKKKKEILYPISLKGSGESSPGSLLGYYFEYLYEEGEIELIENIEFYAELEYQGYSRGRSSVTINFKGNKGENYPMFLSDFDDVLKNADIINRKVYGKWTFCKKGKNFGIKIIPEE